MPEGRRRPQVAHADDYDSESSSIRPGTTIEARRKTSTARPLKTAERQSRPGPPDAASDSGYSSHTNANVAGNGTASLYAPITRGELAFSARSKPIIHRSDSQQRGAQQRQAAHCTELNCRDANCVSSRNPERRYTLHAQPQPQPAFPTQYPAQNPQSSTHYQQIPAYQYPQSGAAQPIPTPNTQAQGARPRAVSTTQPRPISWSGGAYGFPSNYIYGSTPPQGNYVSATHGPPPSPSAYQTPQHAQYFASLYAQQQAMAALQLGSTPPTNAMTTYPPPSPGNAALPVSNLAVQRTPQPTDFSARRISTSYSGYDMNNAPTSHPQPVPVQKYSARALVPGSFPGEPAVSDTESESVSASSSSSSYSDDSEYEHREQRQQRERRGSHGRRSHHHRQEISTRKERESARDRDRKRMPPPQVPQRPALKSSKTTPTVSTHPSREPSRRAPHSDTGLEYFSPPDNMNGDRAARPVVERRSTHSSANSRHSSRGPSVSTNSSSGWTPATTVSNDSRPARYIVEDPYGQRRAYYSREEAELTAQRLQQRQKKLEEDILAYQSGINGSRSPELTLENIERSQKSRPSSSRVSGSSKKSVASSKISKTDTSFQIKTGDTVFQVTGDAKIELHQSEDGGQTLTIGSASGRESKYYASSSRSSGSRVERSRQGSEMGRRRDTIHEEDGYEPGV